MLRHLHPHRALVLLSSLSLLTIVGCGGTTPTPPSTSPQSPSTPVATTPIAPSPTSTSRPTTQVSFDRNRPILGDEQIDRGNLLRLPTAKVEATTAPASEAAEVKALADDNPNSVGAPSAAPDAPVEIVYGFGGASVTPERLVILFPRQAPPGAATAKVEILVSTLSAQAGFQSVRADPLVPERRVQEFVFRPIAARWIMLRFTPPAGATKVAIAEVAVLGREGPPVSLYAFKESPTKAIDLLARLKQISSLKLEITPEEAALFEDARDGKFDQISFAEATLLASGVTKAEQRKAYLQQLAKLEAEAQKQVTDAAKPYSKGEKLLRWLHTGQLAQGYVGGQSDLSVILDNRTYNCVSSTVIYNALGRRLGLDLRAIEVPDHVFAIQYDGKDHADVETTTAAGHNPARDPVVLEEFKKRTGFSYIPDSHRDRRREIGEVGLTAIIYYNHGVELTHAKRYHEALLAYFRAMSLDPEFVSAIKNALVTLALWCIDLSRNGKYEDALQVLATGLDLAPHDATLRHGRKVVWTQWALSRLDAGQEAEALAILARAAKAVPDETGHFENMQCLIFIVPGEAQVKKGDWEGALTLGTRGREKLQGRPRDEVHRWQTSTYLRWAQDTLQRKQFDQTLTILDRARAAEPKEPRFANALAVTIQEMARTAHAEGGIAKARSVLAQLRERYKGQPAVARGTLGYLQATVKELCDGGKYANALEFIDQSTDLLPDRKAGPELTRSVYAAHADEHLRHRRFEEAIAVYQAALQRFPDDVQFKAGIAHVVEAWVKDTYQREGKVKAQELLTALVKRYAAMLENAESIEVFLDRLVAKEKDAGNFAEAIAILERHGDLLADNNKTREQLSSLYDAWAWKLMQAKDFEGAIAVYETARQRFPDDTRLQNNFIVAVQDGSWGIYESLGEQEARRFFAMLLQRYPEEKGLVERLHYHLQRLITKLCEANQFDEAEAAIARHRHLLPQGTEVTPHYHHLYDEWASNRSKAKDWLGAVQAFQRGLQRLPGDDHLHRNFIAGVQNWSWSIYTSEGEEPARTFLTEMRQRFPSDKAIDGRIEYHVVQIKRQLERNGEYAEALAAAERHRRLLRDEAAMNKIIQGIYDNWAGSFTSKEPKDWQRAVDTYAEGVKRYPQNASLRHNAIVTWDRWAKTFFNKQNWDEAIKIYKKGLEAYPDAALLKDNLTYCEKKKGK